VPPISLPLGGETPRAQKSARHPLFTGLRLAAGVAILVYLARSGIISFAALSKLIVAWPITLAAIGVFLVDIFLMALRTSWLFRPLGMNLTVWKSMQLTLVSIFFSTFLPGAGGGDLVKLYYATKENVGRRTEVATVLMFDRTIGFFAMLILPFFFVPMSLALIQSVPMLRSILVLIAFLSAGLLAVFLLCAYNQSFSTLLSRESRILPRWRNIVSRVLETVRAYGRSPRTLLGALVLSLLANLSVIAITVLAVLVLDPASLSSKMCLVIPIGHVVNALPLTPGGLGVGETALNALFELTGLHGGAETLLFWRVWKAMVGLLGLLIYVRGMSGVVFVSESGTEEQPAT
jgi:glycosyltransferase 2 family protein